MPTWNETRVRVDGFSNSSAMLRSWSGRPPAGPTGPALFNSTARSTTVPSSVPVSSVPTMKWCGSLTVGF
jgi:hypothetical protein